jgi:hypothetical protein
LARLAALICCCSFFVLSGCTPPASDERPREVRMQPAPVPAPARPAQIRPQRATWTFESGSEQCVASADAGAASVRVTVRRHAAVELLVSLATQAPVSSVPLHFSGPAGDWQVQARRSAARTLGVTLGTDNTALSHVLVLLGGGIFDVGTPERPIASFVIAPSDARGQAWFDCARGMML